MSSDLLLLGLALQNKNVMYTYAHLPPHGPQVTAVGK